MKQGVKKGLKITAWVFGSLLFLIVLATLLISPIAKSYINSHGEELVGRKVHVDEVTVNVYSGHLALRGFTLYEDNGADTFARFDTLDVDASLFKLLSNTVQLNHITLAGLTVNVVKNGEDFNFQSMLDHFASDSTEEEQDTTPSDWVIKIYNIRLNHAQIHFNDVAENKQWHLPDINLRVPGFVLGGDETSKGGLHIAFDNGGDLNLGAHYNEQQGSYDLAADLTHFQLKNIEPLAADFLRFDKLGGSLTLHIKANGNINEITRSHIGGSLSLRNLDLRNGGSQMAELKSLTVDINNIDLENNAFDIQSLKLDGFTATYEQWADHSNIDDLLKPSGNSGNSGNSGESEQTTEVEETSSPAKPLALTLHELAVTDGSLTYVDHTLPDPFSFPVTKLNIEATDLTLSGNNNAKLRALLPGGGHLMVKWEGDIDHWKQHQDIFISVKGLDMKQLSPWTVYFTGNPIEDGIFSFTSRNTIKNSNLNGKNKIDIYNAKVGSRRKDVEPQQKLPLKTALYILKDKDNKILFDVPIAGNIDNPEFSYMKLVWQTLGNLLVKVATSPVRALGNAFGIGGDDLDFIEIDPQQRGLTSEQYHILGDLATVAKSDSLVHLTLELQMPAAADDSAAHRYEFRNGIVRHYLIEQGVNERQFTVTTGEPVADGQKTGYAITSELKLEEEK
jgi:hypothetical protein